MTSTSNQKLQPHQQRQLFCLHHETHCLIQTLELGFLLFALLSLLFDMYLSDCVFWVLLVFYLFQALLQALDLFF